MARDDKAVAPARKAPQDSQAAVKKSGEVLDHPARTARPATPKKRHNLAALSFVALVVAPALATTAYLYFIAADQYASRMSFSIRGAENVGPMSFLGALSQTVTIGGTDAEIVYDFVRSQQMVRAAFERLPLERIYNEDEDDIVFSLGHDRSIEDFTDYWNYMTTVSYDGGSGIVDFEARAFDPENARAIAQFVLEESTRIVNDISTQARDDAVSVARGVLDVAEARLRTARRDVRTFRNLEQELDPSENARATLELVAGLRQALSETQVELNSYLALVGPRGPRAPALRQRIESLEERIADERTRLGAGADGQPADDRRFSDLMGDYEELQVEREFAENAYLSALASYEQAQVEARRQTRFLSPHISPTLSVEAEYPQRPLIAAAAFVILSVGWAVGFLILYNIRDRR